MSDPRDDSRGGSLAGLLVVSIEQAVSAPLCTVRLADAGARVIKIERTEGETARHYDSSIEACRRISYGSTAARRAQRSI